MKKQISVTLDEEVYERIKELAEKNGRSISGYINMLLKKHAQQKRNDEN